MRSVVSQRQVCTFQPSIVRQIVGELHEAALASPDEDGAGASLLIGSSGILLVAHRLVPSAATADALADALAERDRRERGAPVE
jgi:hypothetical protein